MRRGFPWWFIGPVAKWTRRLRMIPCGAFADPPLVDDAAELLASAPLHAILYAFTSS
jgi:hypothetical protein